MTLLLESGALATSGVDRRRWRRGGRPMHHVIAPRRGLPADTDLLRATAVAPTCAEADALATALLVAGARDARRLADVWAASRPRWWPPTARSRSRARAPRAACRCPG